MNKCKSSKSLISRRDEIIGNIAGAYSKHFKNTSIKKSSILKQYQTVYCAISKACGDCMLQNNIDCTTLCADNSCESCLDKYIDINSFTENEIAANLPYIKKLRSTLCSQSCLCDLNVNMSEVVIIPVPKNTISFSSEEKQNMINDITTNISKDYCGGFMPDLKNIAAIVNNNEFTQSITSRFNKTVANTQTFYLVGTGTVVNLNMTMMTDFITETIFENASVLKSINDVVSSSIESIKRNVDNKFKSQFQLLWDQNKVYFFITGGILLLMMLTIVFLSIYKSFHP